MQYGMTNSDTFSELTLAQAHGSGPTIGGGPYLHDVVWVEDFAKYVSRCTTPSQLATAESVFIYVL